MTFNRFIEILKFRFKTYIFVAILLTPFFIIRNNIITSADKYNLAYNINEDGSVSITENIIINVRTNDYQFNYFIPHSNNEEIDSINIAWRESGKNSFTTYSSLESSNKFDITKFPDGTRIVLHDNLPKGKFTFKLDYSFNKYVYLYKDTALFKRTILSHELFKKLKTSTVTMSFAKSKIDFDKLNFFVSGNMINDVSENKLGNIEIDLKEIDFKKEKILTVLIPSHYISKNKNIIFQDILKDTLEKELLLEKENTKVKSVYIKNKSSSTQVTLFSVISSGVLFLISYIYLQRRFLKKIYCDFDKKYYPAVPGNYSPFETSYLLYNKKIDLKTLMASLFDLVEREYLTLDIENNMNFRFGRGSRKDFHNLKKSEQFLMKWLINDIGNHYFFDVRSFEKTGANIFTKNIINLNFRKWVTISQKEANQKGFYVTISNTPYNVFFVNMVFSLLLMTINIFYFNSYLMIFIVVLEIIFIYIFTNQYNYKLSAYGQEQFLKWYAFKNYLIDFDKFESSSKKTFSVWEKYIVHSLSLGITKEVLDTTSNLFDIKDAHESKLFKNYLKIDLYETITSFHNCYKNMELSMGRGLLHYKKK